MSNVPKKILVVEDDESYRTMVSDLLKEKGFDVNAAADGHQALQELALSSYDLIISDIQMPLMHGIDLLVESKKKYPHCPFILMTGFSYILETHEAYALGADGFILKPFQMAELLKIVFQFCSPTKLKPKDRIDKSQDYYPMHIDEFISGSTLLYDIFIKLNKYKFIKIASRDDYIDSSILEHYKSKGIETLHICKDDYRLYLGLNVQIFQAGDTQKKFGKDVQAHLITNITGMFNALVIEGTADAEITESMKDFCIKGFSLISDYADLMKILASINEASTRETAHSSSVAFIASAIAKKLKWYSKGTAHKLYLSAFLHDIGKKNFSNELLKKSTAIMTKDEYALYKNHVSQGKDILIDQNGIPSDVINAVYEHHENYNGTGFPNGLKREFIHPFARVIRIADDFSNLCYPKEGEPRSTQEAITLMIEHKHTEYDPDFFAAFLKVFNYSLPK